MIKAYLLKDNLILEDGSSGSQIFLDREASCEFEHSESELHEGYFVSEDELKDIFDAGWDSASSCKNPETAATKNRFRDEDWLSKKKEIL